MEIYYYYLLFFLISVFRYAIATNNIQISVAPKEVTGYNGYWRRAIRTKPPVGGSIRGKL